ncbi:MAG: DUF5666 domain-containing protein [Armatimonadota bacterium]
MKKSILRGFLLLILLAIPIVVSAAYQDNYKRNKNYNRDTRSGRNYASSERNSRAYGEIRDIDIRNARIKISGDRKYSTVTLDSDTKIYAKSGKRLRLRDLRRGDEIKVAGASRGNNTIHAVDIYIAINGSIYDPDGNAWDLNYNKKPSSIRVTAVIRSLNSSSGRISIRNARNYDTVIVNNNTRIYTREGRGTSLRNLQQGDSIKIVGYVNRSNQIVATEIREQ